MGNSVALALLACFTATVAVEEADLLIADFEQDSYGDWKVEGEAFGPGPARGTLPGQMEVTGFLGQGLVNSYHGGDRTTGRLTSPAFRIERPYISFLIGGGMHRDQACIDLVVDGKVVRTATGPNDRPGGSERLDWHSWDVREFIGQAAVIRIVDEATGGWGHINIDHITQTAEKRGSGPAQRQLLVEQRYLHLPVKNTAAKSWMQLLVDDQSVREFEIALADQSPDYWVFIDVEPWKGKALTLDVERLPFGSQALAAVRQSDRLPDAESIYREPLRPQFHFTSRRGWLNDPNGLVYYQGEYHLFYQHNPYGTPWGNMTWGHAVSTDLVHWRELPHAIHPDRLGTIYSGSAVVDHRNTSGFRTGNEAPIVCFYTSAGSHARPPVPFTQSLAYSNDRGRTWIKHPGNPVLEHIVGSNRDPKVFWHEPTRRWIMALFLDGQHYALFGSRDMKQWERLSDIPDPGGSECPDLFELSIDGDAKNRRWVFWAGNGNYLIGQFDGTTFTQESGPHAARFGANDYAAQTYSDIPPADGRRIQFSWMSGGKYPDMPFNQQMTVPRVLTLRSTDEGVRLFIEPVKELESLRAARQHWADFVLPDSNSALQLASGELFDIETEIEVGDAARIVLDIRGHQVEYLAKERQLAALGSKAPLPLTDGQIKLRILIDRTSVEVFANDGRVCMASCFLPDPQNLRIRIYADGGTARARTLTVWELKSIW